MFNEMVEKYGLIYQGIKSIDRGGLLSNTVIVVSMFLPEENFIAFSNHDKKKAECKQEPPANPISRAIFTIGKIFN